MFSRHCERSEAIHLSADGTMDCFRLRARRFGGLPTLRSLPSKRRRVVASLLAMTVVGSLTFKPEQLPRRTLRWPHPVFVDTGLQELVGPQQLPLDLAPIAIRHRFAVRVAIGHGLGAGDAGGGHHA